MIWRASHPEEADRAALADYLRGLAVQEAGISEEAADSPARAVAACCQQRHPGMVFPSNYLVWMMAGALQAAGRKGAAQQWLRNRGVARPEGLLAVAERVPMPALWRLCSDGRLLPGTHSAGACELGWEMDLRVLDPEGRGLLELYAVPRLERSLSGIAPFWDWSGGRGSLTLRGRRSCPVPARQWCADILDVFRRRRRWRERPRVFWAELAGA